MSNHPGTPQIASQRMLVELIDIWYDIPVDTQVSIVGEVAHKAYNKLNRWRKFSLIIAALVISAILIYIASENWALAFLLGVCVGLIAMWAINR